MSEHAKNEPRLLFIAGSSREKSFNKRLAKLGERIADANGIAGTFADLGDYPMPLWLGLVLWSLIWSACGLLIRPLLARLGGP
mgnify:CR=1 FL=1